MGVHTNVSKLQMSSDQWSWFRGNSLTLTPHAVNSGKVCSFFRGIKLDSSQLCSLGSILHLQPGADGYWDQKPSEAPCEEDSLTGRRCWAAVTSLKTMSQMTARAAPSTWTAWTPGLGKGVWGFKSTLQCTHLFSSGLGIARMGAGRDGRRHEMSCWDVFKDRHLS